MRLDHDAYVARYLTWQQLKDLVMQRKSQTRKLHSRSHDLDGCDAKHAFLLHAQVYVFAHCYGISILQDRAFYKLGKAMLDIPFGDDKGIDSGVLDEVVELLRYYLEDTRPEKLRTLVELYVASKLETLIEYADFRILLEENGHSLLL